MAEQDEPPIPLTEDDKHALQQRGFTLEQIQAIQHIAQEMATKQLQRAITVTNNLIVTLVAVLSSALGLTTALAWNRAMSDWLPHLHIFNTDDPLTLEFLYAGFITTLTIVVVGVMVALTSRIKGENLMKQ